MRNRKANRDWVLGIDISTSGVKVMILGINGDGRRVSLSPPAALDECVAQAEHDAGSGRDPAAWLATFRRRLRRLSDRFPDEIAAVRSAALSTIFPGLYVLPRRGPLDIGLVRLYNDLESAETIAKHAESFLEFERENRNVIYPGTMVANALLLMETKRMPPAPEVACLALPNTAFVWQLYREAREPLCEYPSDFSEMVIGGVLEPVRFGRCRSLRRLFGHRDLPFPTARPSWHNVLPAEGEALARVRDVLGLPTLQSLCIGAGDAALGALALGAVLAPGGSRLLTIRGSSDTPIVVVPRPYRPGERRFEECLFHYPSPVTGDAESAEWFSSASILRSGAVWHWYKGIMGQDHASLEDAAKASLVRAAGKGARAVFVPFLGGERAPSWNPDARGILFGLTTDTTAGDLALSVMEGVSFTLRADLELTRARYPEEMAPAGSMVIAGKPARSALWNWITEQITGYRVQAPKFAEASVLGAALVAWAGLQPCPECRRRLVQASLASQRLLLEEPASDLNKELAPVRRRYRSGCEYAYREFRELYRRLSLREKGRARRCEEEFAGVGTPARGGREGPLNFF